MVRMMILFVLAGVPVMAQVQTRPADPPIVTAENDTWFIAREPITHAGGIYRPAGSIVFFERDTMVRTGHYSGVPLYTDTTLEPHSIVFVPIGRGLMQPYERERRGDVAGTTGSRTPSFPVRISTDDDGERGVSAAPMPPARPTGELAASDELRPVGTAGRVGAQARDDDGQRALERTPPRYAPAPVVSLLRPESNDGLWINYAGARWVSAGPAVPIDATRFRHVGKYEGFPVFERIGASERVIYIPTRAGLIAPYRRKG